jgi:hypothetical protein
MSASGGGSGAADAKEAPSAVKPRHKALTILQ